MYPSLLHVENGHSADRHAQRWLLVVQPQAVCTPLLLSGRTLRLHYAEKAVPGSDHWGSYTLCQTLHSGPRLQLCAGGQGGTRARPAWGRWTRRCAPGSASTHPASGSRCTSAASLAQPDTRRCRVGARLEIWTNLPAQGEMARRRPCVAAVAAVAAAVPLVRTCYQGSGAHCIPGGGDSVQCTHSGWWVAESRPLAVTDRINIFQP